jgi:hypothetical protein
VLALGSQIGPDYNIFAVSHIWQLAERRLLQQGMRLAIPQSTRAINAFRDLASSWPSDRLARPADVRRPYEEGGGCRP